MGSYEVVRMTTIAADAARIHALVDDFHHWQQWSPWEDVDPAMQRTYTGPDSGVGAHYEWSGNRKAGRGSMEIVASTPEAIDVALVFQKPFSATNDVRFSFAPDSAGGTTVEWRMRGEQSGVWGVLGKLINMDKLVGKDFEKGLARLRSAAEA
ncbi:SRPBCC family protein [Nocardioides mangrovi]|uniref:SRPBCC family protein n=1 Tax=Nocardioides mangrovi TaxID=2874580 RepID=A0ABS7U8B2_9ACTN|nr:SRPBCC family protein [Nocardioides mangrovi]MBZ5737214.1 SRPBCC family protein [Nocardioides mangrovi]